jgi:hypothetical protein
MYTLAANKRWLWYALQLDNPDIPETDIDGNPIYQTIDGVQVPVYTHNQEYKYSEPVKFLGNIYDTGGSVEQRPYGHDYETFGGMLVMAKGELPINDGSLIWEKSEPVLLQDGTADPLSADWRVRRASDSINESRYSLERVTKNERY